MNIFLPIIEFLRETVPFVALGILILATAGYVAIWLYRWFNVLKDVKPVADEWEKISETVKSFEPIAKGWEKLLAGIDQINSHLGRIDTRFDKMDDRFDKMDDRFDKMDDRFDKMDDRFDKTDNRLDKMNNRLGKVEGDVGELKTDVGALKNNFTMLNFRLGNVENDVGELKNNSAMLNFRVGNLEEGQVKKDASNFANRHSPQVLNDAGREVANRLGADFLADMYYSEIPLEGKKTAYAIQEACFDFARLKLPNLLPESKTMEIENIAYEKGVNKYEIYDPIFAILLRDKVFKQRNIPIPKPKPEKQQKSN